jgi:hypothetical protein
MLDELSRPIAAPDMTRSIMGRMGYVSARGQVAARRRRRRLLGRTAMTLTVAMALVAGLQAHRHGGQVRRPIGPTIPAALGHDLQQHHERVNRAIRTIRDRSMRITVPLAHEAASPAPAPRWPGPGSFDEDVDRSAVGPVQWI